MSPLVAFVLASALLVPGAAAAQAPTRQQSQALGSALGNSALAGGELAPGGLVTKGTTQGANNVWGDAYTGQADPAQTNKVFAPSMVGIGNEARTQANTSFKGYTDDREDQASQATYFLDQNKILKPTIAPGDPLNNTSNIGDKDIFGSETSTTCRQEEVLTHGSNAKEYSCIQSYNPYVLQCNYKTNVTVGVGPTCPPGKVCGQKDGPQQNFSINNGGVLVHTASTFSVNLPIDGTPGAYYLTRYHARDFSQLWINGTLVIDYKAPGYADMRGLSLEVGTQWSSAVSWANYYFINGSQFDPGFHNCNTAPCAGMDLNTDITRFLRPGSNSITMACLNASPNIAARDRFGGQPTPQYFPCNATIRGHTVAYTYAETQEVNDCAVLEEFAK